MDMALGPIEIADMRDRARQVLHEADDAEAEAGAYLIRSGGGGTFRQFYDERMERVDKLRALGKQLEDEALRHEAEARRIRNSKKRS
ncbi:hypothetical protein DEU31_0164 [Brachybacterium sp. AG952]|uniref:hypothetical protein n=1 Tax=Brachybacterium sp. AG952 TaxID=2183989 RepID=UPI00105DA09A|nr:hypothetical protein [Brachybacterium sp. AG952]TDP79752.1 hypothetical protein DEU31_0164 [Brachybacterium sp. AG952]